MYKYVCDYIYTEWQAEDEHICSQMLLVASNVYSSVRHKAVLLYCSLSILYRCSTQTVKHFVQAASLIYLRPYLISTQTTGESKQ